MKRLLLVMAVWTLALPAGASSEFQLWTEAGVQVKLDKQWRLRFDQHVRFDENLSATDSIMPELGVSFRPAKFIRLEVGYRYVAEPIESLEDTYVESWQRFFADVQLRHRFKPVTLKYRLRFEEEFGWPWKRGEELVLKHTLRNQLGVEVKLPLGFAPFLSGELFLRLADPDGVLHKWRLTAGLDYRIASHTVSLYYRFEDMLDDAGDPTRQVLGVGYHYEF
jgi:hypothetical protein